MLFTINAYLDMFTCLAIFLLTTSCIMLFPWLKFFSSFTLETIISKPFAIVYNTSYDLVPACFPSLLSITLPHCSLNSSYSHLFLVSGTCYNWTPIFFPTSNTMHVLFLQFSMVFFLFSLLLALSHSSQLKCNLLKVFFCHSI